MLKDMVGLTCYDLVKIKRKDAISHSAQQHCNQQNTYLLITDLSANHQIKLKGLFLLRALSLFNDKGMRKGTKSRYISVLRRFNVLHP